MQSTNIELHLFEIQHTKSLSHLCCFFFLSAEFKFKWDFRVINRQSSHSARLSSLIYVSCHVPFFFFWEMFDIGNIAVWYMIVDTLQSVYIFFPQLTHIFQSLQKLWLISSRVVDVWLSVLCRCRARRNWSNFLQFSTASSCLLHLLHLPKTQVQRLLRHLFLDVSEKPETFFFFDWKMGVWVWFGVCPGRLCRSRHWPKMPTENIQVSSRRCKKRKKKKLIISEQSKSFKFFFRYRARCPNLQVFSRSLAQWESIFFMTVYFIKIYFLLFTSLFLSLLHYSTSSSSPHNIALFGPSDVYILFKLVWLVFLCLIVYQN